MTKSPQSTKEFQAKAQAGGYTARDMCDGQALPSPGRWPIASRRYPASPISKALTRKFEEFSAQYGTAELLMNLALGRVQENAFREKDIQVLEQDVNRRVGTSRFGTVASRK